jgi:hypothetical protein
VPQGRAHLVHLQVGHRQVDQGRGMQGAGVISFIHCCGSGSKSGFFKMRGSGPVGKKIQLRNFLFSELHFLIQFFFQW